MCIAIAKPEGMLLSGQTLKNCWDSNPDGAGFMYPEKGKVVIVKGLMTFDEFMTAYEPHKEKQAALHFRIATHGGVNKENTHPFQVTPALGMVHNGIISKVNCDLDKTMSDTWHFNEKILKKFPFLWKDSSFKELVESYIGYSKLILMNGEGEFNIYNESSGVWDCSCWFSNTSYKTKTYTTTKSTKQSKHAWEGQDEVKIGDYRRLLFNTIALSSGGNIPSGTLVQIEAFGQGAWVWVVVREAGTFQGLRAKVSQFLLDEKEAPFQQSLVHEPEFAAGKEVIFAQNYNHFRVGDKAIVKMNNQRSLILCDPLTQNDKSYLVPKSFVRPAHVLLLN